METLFIDQDGLHVNSDTDVDCMTLCVKFSSSSSLLSSSHIDSRTVAESDSKFNYCQPGMV